MTMESGQIGTPGTLAPDYVFYDEDSNATPEDNFTGSADDEIHIIEIDCQNNPGEDVYTRFYAATSATVATDAADCMIKGFKGKKKTVIARYWDDAPAWTGIEFATGLSMATSKDAGAQTGATDPTGTVKVRLGVVLA